MQKTNEKFKTWFGSDFHFFHENAIKYDQRPFASVEEMNQHFVKMWKKVKPEDLVYIIGDVSLVHSKDRQALKLMLSELPGRIVLVKGNHDESDSFYRSIGWIVVDRIDAKFSGRECILTHYPPLYEPRWLVKLKIFFKIIKLRYVDEHLDCDPKKIYIVGHSHSQIKRVKNRINVCINAWSYDLIPLQKIEQLIGLSSEETKFFKRKKNENTGNSKSWGKLKRSIVRIFNAQKSRISGLSRRIVKRIRRS